MAIDDAYPTSASTLSTMAEWEEFFTGFSADGVIPGFLNELVPSLNAGARTAVIGTGAAQIRGFHVKNPSSTATAIPAADAQNRIDRLVLRLDRSAVAAGDWITPVVIEGTPSASPQPPALVQTPDGYYDIPIARWTSASNGSLSGLVDERVFAAASPVEFRSDARPPATLRRYGFERNTGRVMYADGTTWRTVWEDLTAQATLTPTSNWRADGTCQVSRSSSGLIEVTLNLIRINTAFHGATAEGSPLANVPDPFRPTGWWRWGAAHVTPDNQVRTRIETDGWVYADNPTRRVDPGRALRFTLVYAK